VLLIITTPAQKVFFSFKRSHQFTVVGQLDRFDIDALEKPFFVLLSELSNLIRNHLHLKVRLEVGGSDVPRFINDVPKYLVLNSLNDARVALFRASPQLYAVGPHRLHMCLYVTSLLCTDRADLLPMSQYIFLYFSPNYSRFFLTCAIQRSFGIRRHAEVFRCV